MEAKQFSNCPILEKRFFWYFLFILEDRKLLYIADVCCKEYCLRIVSHANETSLQKVFMKYIFHYGFHVAHFFEEEFVFS